MKPLAVELRGLTKVFPAVVANDSIDLRVSSGSIHAIVGENGAGKSTAMKMLYGIYRPDAGEILVGGEKKSWRSPSDAIASGIGMVHQHFMLADPYSALENVLLGAEPSGMEWLPRGFRPVSFDRARRELQAIADKHGIKVPWETPVEELPVGIQQQLEIIKLLYRRAEILILDEPTAVLTPQEIEKLFTDLRRLRDEGKTILIITHKLKEVMSLTDRVTVFRGGKVVGERDTHRTSIEELAELMVGRKVRLQVEAPPKPVVRGTVLEIQDLSTRAGGCPLRGLNLSLRGGEIVGIAGVEGNGQSELLRALLQPAEVAAGSNGKIRLFGQEILDSGESRWETRAIRELGVGLIPEDRHRDGLLLDRPVAENFLLGLQRDSSFGKWGFIRSGALGERSRAAIEAYDVRPRSIEVDARGLSGGNQQKLIIAREFERSPGFLIAAQPTRGVDVGAIEFIHQRILKAREGGAAVLLVSSELEEILALSDRILVMYEGRFAAELGREQASERELGLAMGGAGKP